jgi:arylsulfatase A-like enzyme
MVNSNIFFLTLIVLFFPCASFALASSSQITPHSIHNETCVRNLMPAICIIGEEVEYINADSPLECCVACETVGKNACIAWHFESDMTNTAQQRCVLKSTFEGTAIGNCTSGRVPLVPPVCPVYLHDDNAVYGLSATNHSVWTLKDGQPVPAARAAADSASKKQPHIFIILQDDLGHDDISFYGNSYNLDVTGNITAAAKEGVILNRHYVHWHCSPTRRSVLTGRLPLHHSEYLSDVSTGDDIDLRWSTLGSKMRQAGYATFWFGKGHTGYKSWNHLPQQLGFDSFVGFLTGAENHFGPKRWAGNCPYDNMTYSADLYGSYAIRTLQAYNPLLPAAKPLFFYLPWQNVHSPYQAPQDWSGDVLRGMLAATDKWTGMLISTLKSKGMWNNSLILYSADNGGTDLGCNWPLRGSKHTNWEVSTLFECLI